MSTYVLTADALTVAAAVFTAALALIALVVRLADDFRRARRKDSPAVSAMLKGMAEVDDAKKNGRLNPAMMKLL